MNDDMRGIMVLVAMAMAVAFSVVFGYWLHPREW